MLQVFLIIFSSLGFSSFYPNNYEESRTHFKELYEIIKTQYSSAELRELPVPTETSENLTISSLYLSQNGSNKDRLLILTSGIHGIEAYVGSAIQFQFINSLQKSNLLDHMGILILHSVNPYGYHFNRRVSENNVDLNRNLSATPQLFEKKIPTYEKFDDFLNPTTKASSSLSSTLSLFLESLYRLVKYGKKQIAQIAVGGQYQNSQGIYFGGNKPEPHKQILAEEFLRAGRDYQKILHIDLHTGYGENGTLHLFSSNHAKRLKGFDKLFKGFSIDTGSDKDFYETSGSFDFFTIQTFTNKQVIPMTFEFGTMDSQTTLGGFLSLKNMIQENQGFQFEFVDEKSKEDIENNFMKMFNPKDPEWRKNTLKQAENTLNTILQRFSAF